MAQCAGLAIRRRFVPLLGPLNTFEFPIVPVSVSTPNWASPSILPRMEKIPLSQGKVAVVDDEDYDWLMEWKWHYVEYATNYGAARTQLKEELKREWNGVPQKKINMNRAIWEKHNGPIEGDLVVNFTNGDGLDLRKENLRLATRSQKQWSQKVRPRGTSQYKGVCWFKQSRKWLAQIVVNYKVIRLGFFEDEKEAARAYNKAARKYFGEFARLNEIEED